MFTPHKIKFLLPFLVPENRINKGFAESVFQNSLKSAKIADFAENEAPFYAVCSYTNKRQILCAF